ncbi:MAG: hypothetical protein PHQ43_12565, partial [Dehalococcoidales bacterium]|nr:hypothetical protein [Dehalococcoidales bacterium]
SITIGRAAGNGAIDIHGAGNTVSFTDPITIQSPGAGGNITVTGAFTTAAANADITFIAGSGNSGLFTLTNGAGNYIASGAGNISITADSISLGAANTISGTGNIILQPRTSGREINLGEGFGAGNFLLDTAAINCLQDGFSFIIIRLADESNPITILNEVTFRDPVIFRGEVGGGGNIITPGDLIINCASMTQPLGLITATGLSINTTAGGIGSANAPLRTNVVTIAANSVDSIYILETNDVAIGSIVGGVSGLTTSAGAGNISLSTVSGSIAVNQPVSAFGSGNVTLTANGPANGITTSAAISSASGAITLEGATIALGDNIQSSGALVLRPSTDASSIGIGGAATGAFQLDDTELGFLHDGFSSITIGRDTGTGVIDVHGGGNTISFADPITIQSPGAGGNITVTGAFTTAAVNADITFIAGSGNSGLFTLTNGAVNYITSGAGNISITADSISLGAANTISGTGNITLRPSTPSRPIVIGAAGVASDFALSTAEIGSLSSGFSSIIIGRADGYGAVAIGSAGNTVVFNSPVTIQSPAAPGSITVIGPLSTAASNSNITLAAANSVALGDGINAGAGNVTISGSAITRTGGIITANTLGLTATSGGIGSLVDPVATEVTTLEATAEGNIFITEGSGVDIGGTNGLTTTANNGGISLTAAGAITNSQVVSANGSGNVTLSGTDITTNANITSGSGTILLVASGNLTTNAIIGGATITGPITLQAATIALGAGVQSSGALLLQPYTAASTIGIGGASNGTFNLDDTELGHLSNGFSSITIGRPDGTGAVDVQAVAFNDPVIIQAGGANGAININGAFGPMSDPITFTADTIAIVADITGTSTITLQPGTPGRTIGIGNGAVGDFNLDVAEIGHLVPGFSLITIGRANGSGAVDVRAVTFNDPVTIQSPIDPGSITVNGLLSTAASNSDITLAAGNSVAIRAGINAGAGNVTIRGSAVTRISGIITANALGLTATNGGIGSSAYTTHISTDVNILAATSAGNSTGIYIRDEAGNVTIGSFGGIFGLTTTANNGDISFTAAGSINIVQPVSANNSGNVTLTANGTTSDITTAATIFSTLGAVTLQAANNIIVAPGGSVNTAGAISLTADSDPSGIGNLTTNA